MALPNPIDEFVASRKRESSPAMQEFITLLKTINQPMEEKEREAARLVVARTCLWVRGTSAPNTERPRNYTTGPRS